jgi:hypothetical protein
MASSKFVLVVTTTNDALTTASEIAPTGVGGSSLTTGAGASESIQKMAGFLAAEATAGRGINVVYFDTAVSASTTGTFTGDPSAGDTVTINGVAFTARASGAVANEYNITAGSVTANAAALAAAINASVTARIVNTVRATSALGVVTFYSVVPGSVGLTTTITESTSNFTLAATTFATGGTQAHNATLSVGL